MSIKKVKDYQDAFGQAYHSYFKGKRTSIIIERNDGYIESADISEYFSEYKDWSVHIKKAMKYVHGRVLDIGCGAGRHSLYLQKHGFEVLGTDVSPLAIKVCKLRGLRKTKVLPVTKLDSKLGKFDTILMLGNNFGLFANKKRAKWLLRRFFHITTENAIIVAESRDPYQTDESYHLEYHKSNRKRGRMGGQIRLRVRFKKYAEPWYDYLLVSKDEMQEILEGTGWRVERFINSEGSVYIALIEKEKV